jgi:hypothetical protein
MPLLLVPVLKEVKGANVQVQQDAHTISLPVHIFEGDEKNGDILGGPPVAVEGTIATAPEPAISAASSKVESCVIKGGPADADVAG